MVGGWRRILGSAIEPKKDSFVSVGAAVLRRTGKIDNSVPSASAVQSPVQWRKRIFYLHFPSGNRSIKLTRLVRRGNPELITALITVEEYYRWSAAVRSIVGTFEGVKTSASLSVVSNVDARKPGRWCQQSRGATVERSR